MFFIMGISSGEKDLDFRQTIICKSCGRYSSVSIFMTYTYLSLFFLPIFKWGKRYVAVSNCCGAMFALDADLGRSIERGERPTLREEDLHPMGAAETVRCPDCGYPLSQDFAYCPKCGRAL